MDGCRSWGAACSPATCTPPAARRFRQTPGHASARFPANRAEMMQQLCLRSVLILFSLRAQATGRRSGACNDAQNQCCALRHRYCMSQNAEAYVPRPGVPPRARLQPQHQPGRRARRPAPGMRCPRRRAPPRRRPAGRRRTPPGCWSLHGEGGEAVPGARRTAMRSSSMSLARSSRPAATQRAVTSARRLLSDSRSAVGFPARSSHHVSS